MSEVVFDAPTIWQQAQLLNRYYEKVGRAAAGQGNCPRFVEFRAGFGLLEESDPNSPVLLPIPPDLETIPGEFYRAIVEVSYSNGVTLCKCEIPQGAIGSAKRHNIIGIYDQDSELVAVCTNLPDWLSPAETYRAFPAVTFPMKRAEAEEVNGNG